MSKFWNTAKDYAIKVMVTATFGLVTSVIYFGYDAYNAVKRFPVLEGQMTELSAQMDTLCNIKKISFRKELEDYTKIKRSVFVPNIGDLIVWSIKYERVGLYRDRQTGDLWYLAPDGKVYQPFYDEDSTQYKYRDRSGVWRWCN